MLNHLVQSLTKEEVRHFKLVTNSVKKGDQRMDLELFETIRSAKSTDGVDQFRKQYYGSNPNAYYRLKNRLFARVSRALLFLHSGDDLHHEVLEFILLAKLFNRRESFLLAYHFLIKAEKKALELDDYDYLNIIYRELIRLSNDHYDIDPGEIIEKQQAVVKKQQEISELNNVLAMVMHQLRRTQNLSKGSDELSEMMSNILKKYATSKEVSESAQFKSALYQVISKFLLQRKDFAGLFDYVKENYDTFLEEKLFSKSNHELKLQMVTYLINSSYELGKLQESLSYSEVLYDEMLRFNKLLYNKYLFFYYNSLVMNFSQRNPAKAIRILKDLEADKDFVSNPYYAQFILLNLSILNMDDGYSRDAIESVEKLMSTEVFNGFDDSLQLQLHLLRLICYYDVEEFEKVTSGVSNLKSKYFSKGSEVFLGYFNALEDLALREDFSISDEVRARCQTNISSVGEGGGRLVYDFQEWFMRQLA